MLLENKNKVDYGAAGSMGAAVARAFALEGAKVFLTGRTQATLRGVADEITAAGGSQRDSGRSTRRHGYRGLHGSDHDGCRARPSRP